MKLSSLLLGDIADLFQDSRISEAETAARAASSRASQTGAQIGRLAQTVEQRLTEIESENAILGLIVLRLLRALAQKDAAMVDTILGDVRDELSTGGPSPRGLEFITKLLGLPGVKKTPVADYARPLTRPIRPPSFAAKSGSNGTQK